MELSRRLSKSLIRAPLQSYVHIDEWYYNQSIQVLRQASCRNSRSISRILNSLQDNQYLTVGDLLHASLEELGSKRNFGASGQLIVLELLEALVKKV
ncbi:DNA-directed RNA polymerase subunit alpha C-terminal domain-containing protein [Paenibacillus tengchongensis]|uniref:DNA-directed RNA polymerase subunit alpha C-terminal domain-containing protein n=1 Tax=Paenibacillus tengchongensis TaxID=2608684 RepID=UPI00124E129E|nr:DNA-directed RNA polymerase subunit alpha C-terminal domain-containing protein [Paenibacillus tengchongensis]